MSTPGETAYTAYSETRGWKAFNGDPLPTYAQLLADPTKQGIVEGWERSASAVLVAHANDSVPYVNKECASRFFDVDVRVEELFWLAGEAAHVSSEFKDLLLNNPEPVLIALGQVDDGGEQQAERVLREAAQSGKYGFLVELATPVIDPSDPNDPESSYRCSWGHYHTEWFYADALNEDFVNKAEKWVEERHQNDRAEALKDFTAQGGYTTPPAP